MGDAATPTADRGNARKAGNASSVGFVVSFGVGHVGTQSAVRRPTPPQKAPPVTASVPSPSRAARPDGAAADDATADPAAADDDAAGRAASVISAHGVVQRFNGHEALSGLDLAIPAGTVYGFIGPSGAGKTTGIRVLTGALAPTAGDVRVLGEEPSAFDAAQRARIGYMPQQSMLFPQLSVRRNLSFVASVYGLPLRRRKRLRRLLAFLELDEHRRKPLEAVSGGMQRRLALAAALVHDPEVLFLDEPTAGIDPVLRHKFWEHFAHLKAQGRTLFVTTQYVSEAAYCDRVAVLRDGKVITEGTPDELRQRAYGGDLLELRLARVPDHAVVDELRAHPLVVSAHRGDEPERLRLVVHDGSRANVELPDWLQARGLEVHSAEPDTPPFDDVFVALLEHTDEG